jgi:SnoaL-like domain
MQLDLTPKRGPAKARDTGRAMWPENVETLRAMMAAFNRRDFEPEEIIEVPDGRVLAVERWRARGRQGIKFDFLLVDVYTFRDGLIVRIDGFRDRTAASKPWGCRSGSRRAAAGFPRTPPRLFGDFRFFSRPPSRGVRGSGGILRHPPPVPRRVLLGGLGFVTVPASAAKVVHPVGVAGRAEQRGRPRRTVLAAAHPAVGAERVALEHLLAAHCPALRLEDPLRRLTPASRPFPFVLAVVVDTAGLAWPGRVGAARDHTDTDRGYAPTSSTS